MSRAAVLCSYPPGGRLGPNYTQMRVSESEGHGSFLRLQGSEMSENVSLKMGVKIAASLTMGVEYCVLLYPYVRMNYEY